MTLIILKKKPLTFLVGNKMRIILTISNIKIMILCLDMFKIQKLRDC